MTHCVCLETKEIYFQLNSTFPPGCGETAVCASAGKGNSTFPLWCGTAGPAACHVTLTTLLSVSNRKRLSGRHRPDRNTVGTRRSYSITPDWRAFPPRYVLGHWKLCHMNHLEIQDVAFSIDMVPKLTGETSFENSLEGNRVWVR